MYETNLTVAAVRSCSSISFLSQQWKEIVDVYLQNKWLFNSIYALKTLKSPPLLEQLPGHLNMQLFDPVGKEVEQTNFQKFKCPIRPPNLTIKCPHTLFGNTFNQFESFYAYLQNTVMFVETLYGEQIAHKSGVHFHP